MRRKGLLIGIGAAVVLVILLVGPGTSFYTDLLWYKDAGFDFFYTKQIGIQTVLFIIGALLFAVIVTANVVIATKVAPIQSFAITNDVLFNLRRTVDPVAKYVVMGAIAFGSIIFGSSLISRWPEVLQYLNGVPSATKDPIFHKNVSFYFFSLPMWKMGFAWLFGSLILTIIFVVVIYGYAGAIGRLPGGRYLAPHARTHLSILLGFLLLLKALGYQINQWELLYSPRGVVSGASYTDVHAQLPAFEMLFWIAIGCAILLFATFWIKRLVLAVVAIALMAVSALIIGGLYPMIIQQFRVVPNEIQKETPYIKRNIDYTRKAFGLDKVQQRDFAAEGTMTPEELDDNKATLKNVRLWDDNPLLTTYRQIQEIRAYYQFESVGVDRYNINDLKTQTLTSAREIDPTQLDARARTWQNLHLVYTHGFGGVVSPSNDVGENGGPNLLVRNIPPVNVSGSSALDITQPRIYYGQRTDNFVLVDTTLSELDRPKADEEIAPAPGAGGPAPKAAEDVTQYRYEGTSGIKMDSFVKKLAYAIQFGDSKFILSSAIQPKSRLLYDRNIMTRVRKIAPLPRL